MVSQSMDVDGEAAGQRNPASNRTRCFLDIAINDEYVGRIVVELYSDLCPVTAENFRALCTGERGVGAAGKPLHYKNTIFHRIVPGFMIQGGDIYGENGAGGESIYGRCFPDESFARKHDRAGLLSMANAGPDTNGSQFFITTVKTPHLDGKHVVFGEVKKGLGLVHHIEISVTDDKDRPQDEILVVDCGELASGEEDGTLRPGELYPDWPEDFEDRNDPARLVEAATHIKQRGNDYFRRKEYRVAAKRYTVALRYLAALSDCKPPTPDDGTVLNGNEMSGEDVSALATEQEVSCLLNRAAANLHEKDFRTVAIDCSRVLGQLQHTEQDQIKALFRRGEAYLAMNNYDAASADLNHAISLAPKDPLIRKSLLTLREKKARQLAIERAIFSTMLTADT